MDILAALLKKGQITKETKREVEGDYKISRFRMNNILCKLRKLGIISDDNQFKFRVPEGDCTIEFKIYEHA